MFEALALLLYLFYCLRVLSCAVEKRTRPSTAAVQDGGTTRCPGMDKLRAEPGFCRWSIMAIGLGVSLATLASVLSDVTAPAVRLSDDSAKNPVL